MKPDIEFTDCILLKKIEYLKTQQSFVLLYKNCPTCFQQMRVQKASGHFDGFFWISRLCTVNKRKRQKWLVF
jgi:hypothetical protein